MPARRSVCIVGAVGPARVLDVIGPMGSLTPNPKKRGFLLPPGCKDLIHILQRTPPTPSPGIKARVNGKIRAPEVRVLGERGGRLGIMAISDALRLAQSRGVDLVEIAPHAKPPVCRLVDYGKYRYEQFKKRQKHK